MKKIFIGLFFISASLLSGQLNNPKNIPFAWKTDTAKSAIDLSELMVVLPRGSFDVLVYPQFIDKSEGLKSFYPQEPVMILEMNGSAKAYPLNLLSILEIANDTIAGIPILATFCPLCNSAIVFDRRVNFNGKNHMLDFEVSGMLRKSDMVMADKQTETWWQQLEGKGIVGELSGAELKVIPSLVLSVEEFFNKYPNGKILSKDNGSEEDQKYYGKNFYTNYDDPNGKPYKKFFESDELNKKLSPMERIVEIRSQGEFKVYPYSIVKKYNVLNDKFNSKNVVLFYKSGVVSVLDKKEISESKDVGTVTVFNSKLDGIVYSFTGKDGYYVDDKTNSIWDVTGTCIKGRLQGKRLSIEPYGNHFAFAWLAFHPESIIYLE